VTAANASGERSTVKLPVLLRGMRAAQDRQKIMGRMLRVFGVTAESLEKALELPREKYLDPSQLTAEEKILLFGLDVPVIDTLQVQGELLDTEEIGNGNGSAKSPAIIRKAGEVDLAFLRSHEFASLLGQVEPLTAVGVSPFRVEPKDRKQDSAEYLFETNDLFALHKYLMESGRKGMTLQRYKGLGEMNAEQLMETTMNPENRVLLEVTAEDETAADDMFTTLMGDLVEPRKDFIEKHAVEVQNLDV
jgi:hypothetical protein